MNLSNMLMNSYQYVIHAPYHGIRHMKYAGTAQLNMRSGISFSYNSFSRQKRADCTGRFLTEYRCAETNIICKSARLKVICIENF